MNLSKFLILAITVLAFHLGYGQDLLPFATNNYSGVSAVPMQPASIADSRFKFDMALVSGNMLIANDLIGLKHDLFNVKTLRQISSEENFGDKYIIKFTGKEDKTMFAGARLDALSLMITLNDKSAIAITPSVRAFVNVDNVSQDLLDIVEAGKITADILHQELTNANLSVQANVWAETGFTYARVVFEQRSHFIKAGATLKITQGLGAAYLYGRNINYRFDAEDTIALFNTEAAYAFSDNFDNELNYSFPKIKPGLGFDFGIVYEYRPKWMEHQHAINDIKSIWNRDEEKYLFKFGISVTDIGSIKYRRNPNSATFTANNPVFSTDEADVNDMAGLHDLVARHATLIPTDETFRMNLPAAVRLQADVRINKKLYINILPFIALNKGFADENKSHYYSSVNIIPRFDGRMLGISVPVQTNSLHQTNIGLGLRLGPVWLGSDNFFGVVVGKRDVKHLSVEAAFKIPIFYEKPNDRDKDNIDDKYDKCPDIPGILETGGCPDSDNDGIPDQDDRCPQLAGSKELNGCPDADNDGVIDQNDLCPDLPGLPQFNGCPDSDGDSIIDPYDACPHAAGPASLNGCPDQDNDGIADADDDCPTVAGSKENKGCPIIDSDGDGIYDDKDNCPTLKGPPENLGCPYPDTDGDGIPDKDDRCPDAAGAAKFNGCPDTDNDGIPDKYDDCPALAGTADNKGCPEITTEEQASLSRIAESITFEIGKPVLKRTSMAALDELTTMMLNKPEFIVAVVGYADKGIKPEFGLSLAKNRAMAIQEYLINKGIAESRIRSEWSANAGPADSKRKIDLSLSFK